MDLRYRMLLLAIAVSAVLAVNAAAEIPIPIHGITPVALDKLRVNNPSVLSLAGTWRFQLTHGAMTREGYRSAASGPITASSSQEGHPPLDAIRSVNADARWCASDESMPQWLQVDLGSVRVVNGFDLTWEFQDATYQYRLESSLDGKTWKVFEDHTTAPGVGSGPTKFSPVTCQYVRVTVVGAQRPGGNAWASIRHIDIRLGSGNSEVLWQPPPPKIVSTKEFDAFAITGLNDSTWSTIPVPWNWEMAGFSKPTYDNPDDAVGLYRRAVDVPASFAGHRIIWHFEGVWDSAELFINGKKAGYHESGFTAFDMDVTPFIQPGKRNLLALRVCKTTPSDDLDTGDYWSLGGIYRDTYLVALAPSHITGITITTDLDSQYSNATIGVSASFVQAEAGGLKLHGELFRSDGTRVNGVSLEAESNAPNSAGGVFNLQSKVVHPLLWSAEKPNLYYLTLTLSRNGKIEERVQERFGFRQIEIKNGVVLWNGVPIKCAGTCRHEEWAALGHALNEKAWRTDLTLMKGCNINAVRTSHYNHAGRFLELCDEMGIYVLDEVPACWCNLSDPKLRDAFVQRTKETLDRDKNKPCVLAWSLANESGYGPNAAAMLDYVKANDPTRPAFVSQCGPWNNSKIDFVDTHYPSIGEVQRLAADPMRKTTPVVMTEQPHIFYVADGLAYDYGEKDFWGQVLARNWSVVWPTDSILGSFIWEWQDQGIADHFPGGKDTSGLRGNNTKGIVDGYRNTKPEYWNVKMAYSPVTTSAVETAISVGSCPVPLQNRYSFTDLSELTCKWQTLTGNTVINNGTLHVSCAPRTSTVARFPASSGMDTLRIAFVHPDGRTIYTARLHVTGSPVLPAAPAPAPNESVSVDKTQDAIMAKISGTAAGTELTIDTHTGGIKSWRVNEVELVSGGPILNLGEHRANHGDHGAANFVESKQAPELRSVVVTGGMEGNDAVIVVKGLVHLAEKGDPVALLTTTYTLRANADLAIKWQLAWADTTANSWEIGLNLLLPNRFDGMTWSRVGLWTEYPSDSIGALTGTATPADLTFRCSKRDVRWTRLADGKGAGICALPGDSPLHTRANKDADGIMLFLSSAISPPYDFSTNLLPDKLIQLRRGERVGGEFVLRPVIGR